MKKAKFNLIFLSTLLFLFSCVESDLPQAEIKELDDQQSSSIKGHLPKVQFVSSASSVVENNEVKSIRVSLDQVATHDLAIDFIVQGANGAKLGSDFSLSGIRTIFISKGQMSANINVRIFADAEKENVEEVFLILQQADMAELGQNVSHKLSIIDSDQVKPNVGFQLTTTSLKESAGNIALQLSLDAKTTEAITVNLQVLGSAVKNSDYILNTTQVMIPAGQLTANLNLSIIDDSSVEQSENIILSITSVSSNAQIKGDKAVHVMNILDNDSVSNTPPPTTSMPVLGFELLNSNIIESQGNLNLNVKLDKVASNDVTFQVLLVGTATEGSDYTITSKQFTIKQGLQSALIQLAIIDDNDYEASNETIQLALTSVSGATMSATSALHTIIIQDNDIMIPPPVVETNALISFEQVSSTVVEGNALNIRVKLDKTMNSNVTGQVAISGNANLGKDYSISSQNFTIPAGQLNGLVTINVIDDTDYEPENESIILSLSNVQGANIGNIPVYLLSIQDNDQDSTKPPVVTSLAAFESTLYPIVRMNCAGCHSNGGLAQFANADVNVAHGVMTNGFVNLVNPNQSEIYLKVQKNHQGFSGIAPQVLSSITEWATLIEMKDDNSQVPAKLNFTLSNSIVSEGVGTTNVVAQLDKAHTANTGFTLNVSGGAVFGSDYSIASLSFSIPAGQTSLTIPISIIDDNDIEASEDIILILGNITGGAVLGSQLIHYKKIQDNDVDSSMLAPAVAAFNDTLFPVLRNKCGSCHYTGGIGLGKFAESDVTLSHANLMALNKVDFAKPGDSRLVIKQMENGGHNCSGAECSARAQEIETQIGAWAQKLANLGSLPGGTQGALIKSAAMSLVDAAGPSAAQRVVENMVAFYEFKTGSGTTAFDTSGVSPAMNLELSGSEWIEGGGVKLGTNSIGIASVASSKKLYDKIAAAGASQQFTVEVWVAPENQSDDGPARIVSYSIDTSRRNFTLGQTLYNYNFRNRSATVTSTNGTPSLDTKGNADLPVLKTTLQHVVITFGPNGGRRIYIDGELYDSADTAGYGNLGLWSPDFRFTIGNEVTRNRDFKGSYRLLAVYNKALSANEVKQNYTAGFTKKYDLEFDISEHAGAGAKIGLTVSEFDGHSYLFEKPRFVGVPSSNGIRIKNMEIAINDKLPQAGQAYRNIDFMITQPNQSLSAINTVMLKELGPDLDKFSLRFEVLGNSVNTYAKSIVDSDILYKATEDSKPTKGLNGIRTFEEILHTMSSITGISPAQANINSTYRELKTQLPVTSDVETFLAANQIAIAKLSLEFCDAMVENTNARAQFFPGFNFGQNAVSAFGNQSQKNIIIDNIYIKMVGEGISNQPQKIDIQDEIGQLITDLTNGCSSTSCPAERTKTVVKAACAAVLGSAAVSVK